jgi:serine/threonine protein phosphatase PrpC
MSDVRWHRLANLPPSPTAGVKPRYHPLFGPTTRIPRMKVVVGSATDVGRIRNNNEDSYLVAAPLFVIADGMGGENAGEVASAMAVETVGRMAGEGASTDLAEWVRAANRAVWDRSMTDRTAFGMGTTITAVLADGEQLRLAHVGDSRAYLLRDGEFRRITDDHTRVARMVKDGTITEEEAAVHPERNIITRALGIGEDVKVDQMAIDVRDGDRFLLCTDGLTGMVKEDPLKSILLSTPDPQEAVRKLIEAANAAGGVDNVTAVVLDISTDAPQVAGKVPGSRPARRVGAPGIAALSVVALLVLGLVLNRAGAWPFEKSAATTPTPAQTASGTPTPSVGDSTGVLGEPIAELLPAGATVGLVRNGDLNGDGVAETLVALQGPTEGSPVDAGAYFYVFALTPDGPMQIFDGRNQAPVVDGQTVLDPAGTRAPPRMIGGQTVNNLSSASFELVQFLEVVDFQGLSSPRAVVAIRSATPAGTLQVWVLGLSEGVFHADYYTSVIGGDIQLAGEAIQISSPGEGRRVSYDASGKVVVTVVQQPTPVPPTTTP